MKIVLALAPVWDSVTPPLSLAYLKASVEQRGYACKCIDFSMQFRPLMVSALGDLAAEEYLEKHPEIYKEWAKQICHEKPDVVGFTLLISNIKNTGLIAKEVRKTLPDVMFVSGGPSLTEGDFHNIEEAFTFSDYVIEGEGEQVLGDFIDCYKNRGDYKRLKQLWIKDEAGKIYYTGHAPLQNIDTIPLPDFTDFDRKIYLCPDRLPVLFSRGCILNCNYCTNKWNHLSQRSRNGKLVFEELKRDVKQYGIKEYMFNDDSLISSKTMRQLEEFCDLTIAEGLVMPWSVYGTRVERLITEPYVKKLRASGMDRVALGVETFSSKVQKEMGKSSRYDDADKMCRLFSNNGIRTESWIIFGYPTETDADFNETLNWFTKNPNVLSHVTVNAFGPNKKYFHDRPGIVHYNDTGLLWDWYSAASTIEKRNQRFLQLIEVIEAIRRARPKDFTYHFGDPMYVKYFSSWDEKDKNFLLCEWEKQSEKKQLRDAHNMRRQQLHQITTPIAETAKDVMPKSPAKVHESEFPAEIETNIQKSDPLPETTGEMRELLYKRLADYVNHYGGYSEKVSDEKLQYYYSAIARIRELSKDTIPEKTFYTMALQTPVHKIVEDLEASPAEELYRVLVD